MHASFKENLLGSSRKHLGVSLIALQDRSLEELVAIGLSEPPKDRDSQVSAFAQKNNTRWSPQTRKGVSFALGVLADTLAGSYPLYSRRNRSVIAQGVDPDQNAKDMMRRINHDPNRQGSNVGEDQELRLRNLVRGYFDEERMVHLVSGKTRQDAAMTLYRLLFGRHAKQLVSHDQQKDTKWSQGWMSGQSFFRGETSLVYASLTPGNDLERFLGSFPPASAAVILTPEASQIENLMAWNIVDFPEVVLRYSKPEWKIHLPAKLTREVWQKEMLSFGGLRRVREEQLIAELRGATSLYAPFYQSRLITIPDQVEPFFIDKIVVLPDLYDFMSIVIKQNYQGSYMFGGRPWHEVLISADEYLKDPRLVRVRQRREALVAEMEALNPTLAQGLASGLTQPVLAQEQMIEAGLFLNEFRPTIQL